MSGIITFLLKNMALKFSKKPQKVPFLERKQTSTFQKNKVFNLV